MTRITVSLLLLILSLSLGRARLGESEYRCIQRYGDVQKKSLRTINGVDYPALYFYKSGYLIAVIFSKDAAGVVLFVKPGESAMNDAEIAMLLSTEGDKFKWTESNPTEAQRLWTRPDGVIAIYRNGDHSLTMASKEFAQVALHPPPGSDDDATRGL